MPYCKQNVRQAFSALPDILSPCQTFYVVWPINHCLTRKGLSSLPDIRRSLPYMSGIFCDHWLYSCSTWPRYHKYLIPQFTDTIFINIHSSPCYAITQQEVHTKVTEGHVTGRLNNRLWTSSTSCNTTVIRQIVPPTWTITWQVDDCASNYVVWPINHCLTPIAFRFLGFKDQSLWLGKGWLGANRNQ